MFELGIAQTVRTATDLVVVRSDGEEINFDINHIRIHRYDRADPAAARKLFAECLLETLKQREAEKNLRAEMLRDRLDVESMNLMVKFCSDGKILSRSGWKIAMPMNTVRPLGSLILA